MAKKQKPKDNAEIKNLANSILQQAEEELQVEQDVEEFQNEVQQEIVDDFTPLDLNGTPIKELVLDDPEKDIKKLPISFDHGLSKKDPFVVHRHINEVDRILALHFGNKSGDYIVLSENTASSYIEGQRKRYKCSLIEDRNGFRYFIWFDLTKLGAIY